ncbi:MAG: hypothetical protein ACREIF_14315 [Chthoniobacterales bacterium]
MTETAQLFDEVRNVWNRSLQGNMQLFNRFVALASDTAARFSSTAAQTGTLPSPSETFNNLLQLNVAYWSTLTDHGLSFANDLAGAAEKILGVQPSAGAKAAATSVEIALTASPGERAVAAFQVENNQLYALQVAFRAGDLFDETGARLKLSPVVFTPAALTLPAKSQAVIRAAIEVSAECQVGKIYSLPIELIGFPAKTMIVRLRVVSGKTSAAKVTAKKKAGPTAKKSARKASR